MNSVQAKRLSYIVNTCLLLFVLGLMWFFHWVDATFLVYFSIPTIAVYLINYGLIYKDRLFAFIWLVYFWIVLYMSLTTICLGYATGFHLYSLSMIPVIFYTEYMSYHLSNRSTRAVFISILIAMIYIACSGYTLMNGPIYAIEPAVQTIILAVNACIVLSFISVYSWIVVKMFITDEEKLKKLAMVDKLTELYNRHYMIEQIHKKLEQSKGKQWIAMIDLDGFKGINDRYGHNAGDFVLVNFAKLMKEICKDCITARWGGEEFMILTEGENVSKDVLEQLRLAVCRESFVYQAEEKSENIAVSITVGVSDFEEGMTMDSWIQSADTKLYEGKKNGKNQVVY